MEKVKGFAYHQTPYRFVSKYKNGEWDDGCLSTDANVVLNESACVLQYAQCVFEGLKAYRTKDGKIVCFRPDKNISRMSASCARMKMPVFNEYRFMEAIEEVVKANEEFIPPYGEGGALYLRPYMFGTNPVLGVKPATEFEFRIFASPVGAYFAEDNVRPLYLRICDYDRAAPHGTGGIKAGLNYAMSLFPITEAHELGFDENIYLDAGTRTYIEETGGANIIFVTHDNKIVTPKSTSILPSITRRSIAALAKDYLGLEVEQRQVRYDELGAFKEVGLCGTAAVMTPVYKIFDHGLDYKYEIGDNGYGPIIYKIKKLLTDIQNGDVQGPEGWIHVIK